MPAVSRNAHTVKEMVCDMALTLLASCRSRMSPFIVSYEIDGKNRYLVPLTKRDMVFYIAYMKKAQVGISNTLRYKIPEWLRIAPERIKEMKARRRARKFDD